MPQHRPKEPPGTCQEQAWAGRAPGGDLRLPTVGRVAAAERCASWTPRSAEMAQMSQLHTLPTVDESIESLNCKINSNPQTSLQPIEGHWEVHVWNRGFWALSPPALGALLQPLPDEHLCPNTQDLLVGGGGPCCLPPLVLPLLAKLLSCLMDYGLSVLPGFTYQV